MNESADYGKYSSLREDMKVCVKCLYDYQSTRIRIANRLGKKADGSDSRGNGTDQRIDNDAILDYVDALDATREVEKTYAAKLENMVRHAPEWNRYLKDVKGVGPQMAAVLISQIDIGKAVTVSKIWQYAGMNPGNVYGKRRVGNGLETTSTQVRGDRPTPGYVLPYNKFLRTKLVGVLSTSLLRNPVYRKFYEDYKNRLAHSERIIEGSRGVRWCDTTPMHRDKAARRYMMKMFLIDYYRNVRAIYGMEVRPSYQEEYLEHAHMS